MTPALAHAIATLFFCSIIALVGGVFLWEAWDYRRVSRKDAEQARLSRIVARARKGRLAK